MKLFVDDLRCPNDREATIARTSAEAMALLQDATSLEELWLDHDLGGEDTTRPLGAYLEERAYFGNALPIGKVFLHTSNSQGADWLYAGLSPYYTVVRVDPLAYTYME